MKTIIAGGRNITELRLVNEAVRRSRFDITEVVSGGAKGVDTLGEVWAKRHGIPVKRFPADWSKGKGAGMIRNKAMSLYADQLILIFDGESKGSANMLRQMQAVKKPVSVSLVEYSRGRWFIVT